MKVVLYMRYSSERQTEQSIEGQNRVCNEFCKRQGYDIIGKYIDRATSAFKNTDKRTEFQRMMKDSAKGMFEGVVVYKLDRFARNRYDSATYKTRLKKNGVKVISATENISDNPEGIILESVLEGMAEFYSQELSQKVKRGMNESALKCNTLGGQAPLGYKIVDKKYVIDETTAPIVREAFKLYAEDTPVVRICEHFNKKGYRTATGGEFNKSSFARMFKNKRYIGIYSYKGKETKGGIPAIIDEETFKKVSEKIMKISEAPARGKAKVDYLLAGKIFCGKCGEAMHGTSGTSKTGRIYNYYVCFNRKKHKCDKEYNDKDQIENLVVQDAYDLLTTDTIDKIADIAVEESIKLARDEGNIDMLENKIKDCDSRLKNLLQALEKAPEVELLTERIKALTKERKALDAQLAREKNSIFILEKEQVVWWLNQFLNGDIKDEIFKKRIIDLLVNRVDVYDEEDNQLKLKITFNCIGNNEVVDSSLFTDNGLPFASKTNSFVCIDKYIIIERKHPKV